MFQRQNDQFMYIPYNEVRWDVAWVDAQSQMKDEVRQDAQCLDIVDNEVRCNA